MAWQIFGIAYIALCVVSSLFVIVGTLAVHWPEIVRAFRGQR